MSVNQIANELGIADSTVNKIITELGLVPIKAKFRTVIADAYSPEDIAKIGERLEKGK